MYYCIDPHIQFGSLQCPICGLMHITFSSKPIGFVDPLLYVFLRGWHNTRSPTQLLSFKLSGPSYAFLRKMAGDCSFKEKQQQYSLWLVTLTVLHNNLCLVFLILDEICIDRLSSLMV